MPVRSVSCSVSNRSAAVANISLAPSANTACAKFSGSAGRVRYAMAGGDAIASTAGSQGEDKGACSRSASDSTKALSRFGSAVARSCRLRSSAAIGHADVPRPARVPLRARSPWRNAGALSDVVVDLRL